MALKRWVGQGTTGVQTIHTVPSTDRALVLGAVIGRTGTDPVNVSLSFEDGSANVLFKFEVSIASDGPPVTIDNKMVLASNDVIKIDSDVATFFCHISGDQAAVE